MNKAESEIGGTLWILFQVFFQKILEIAKLPFVCQKCGEISKMKELSEVLDFYDSNDFELLCDKLNQKATQILQNRQQSVNAAKKSLQQSLQQLIQVRQSLGSSFNFDDREKCLERVCEVFDQKISQDIFSNIHEQLEIQGSLSELNQIIQEMYQRMHIAPQEFNRMEYQDNVDIRERLEGALRINQSHKEILKEILIKIGEENKNFTFDIQLQYRQQQLETLNLLQINQDQIATIQKLEDELEEKKQELLKVSVMQSNIEKYQYLFEPSPFRSNKLNSCADESSQFQSLQKDYQNSITTRTVLQELKNTQSKKRTSQTENLCTFQSEQFYSIDQNNSPMNHSHKSSQNSKQLEANQRYGNSISNKFSNSKATTLISQLQIPQQSIQQTQQIPQNQKYSQIRTSVDTNPMASLESMDDIDQNSPKITPTSKTLVSQVPMLNKGRLLILD